MNQYFSICVVMVIALAMIGTTTMMAVNGQGDPDPGIGAKKRTTERCFCFAPTVVTGENVYTAWWTNDTNGEAMFRASTDGGVTFGDKINLSNTPDSNSTRVEIGADADSVVVTWWETNQTDDTPVMRVSNDNGATFGPLLRLATNGTVGQAAAE